MRLDNIARPASEDIRDTWHPPSQESVIGEVYKQNAMENASGAGTPPALNIVFLLNAHRWSFQAEEKGRTPLFAIEHMNNISME